MSVLSFYPKLNDNLLRATAYYSNGIELSYYDDVENINVEIEIESPDANVIVIDDPKVAWDSSKGLVIESKIGFANHRYLFEENGIVNKLSYLGLAVICKSPSSKQRKIEKLGIFKYTDDSVNFLTKFELPKHVFRGSVKLEYVLYVDKYVNVPNLNTPYAKQEGMTLGILEAKQIILDGDGSSFPIQIIEDADKPLWELSMNFTETEELFNRTVSLVLNKAHKDYKYISQDSKQYNDQLLTEIMSNVVSLFILKCKEDDLFDSVERIENTIPGSVGQLIAYYKDIYSPIDTSSTLSVFASVSRGVRKNV